MNDIITLRGTVGTDPRQIKTATGLDITSFRLASTQRRYDRQKQEWVDGDTNWYGISTYRQLARNTGMSIKKGEPVIVTGRIKVQRWESGEKKGLTIDVDADSVGHRQLHPVPAQSRPRSRCRQR
ncbi:MAG TPA: single-stranded DNA-binding protein [Terrimesophilobacter sp.]|nr:single-stranded DNA-binding protein [Terrimesophilobacter sp.]